MSEAENIDAEFRVAFCARITAQLPLPGSLGHVRMAIAEALYNSVSPGAGVEVSILPQTHHGVDAILIKFVAFRGEPINPSWWYQIKRSIQKWWDIFNIKVSRL
jgi:hypothetical protein